MDVQCAIKTDLAEDPDDNSWNVKVKNSSGHGKTFQVKEHDLLGWEFIVKHAYNNMCIDKKQKC
jgi:hypothetical protein